MKRKIQQARRTLAASQQNNRKQARLSAIDARRGMTGGVKVCPFSSFSLFFDFLFLFACMCRWVGVCVGVCVCVCFF